MKQSAVEWYAEQMQSKEQFTQEEFNNITNQAKEIEKQQKSYSEEELKSAFKVGFNIGYGSQVQELDLKNEYCEKWFNKFKNK
jgi:hypothetical protein